MKKRTLTAAAVAVGKLVSKVLNQKNRGKDELREKME